MKVVPVVVAALAFAGAATDFAAPADAPAGLPLVLSGTGPFYVLEIDGQARRLSASPGLDDLRVRNAAGETMAFAWIDPPQPAAAQRVPARLYKVPLPPADGAASNAGEAPPRQAWIVDTRQAGDDLQHLELGLERGTQGVYALRIEASDDLQHWRTLKQEAALVQLQALPEVGAAGALAPRSGQERQTSSGIDLDDAPARYLRLTTAARSEIPPLVSATVTRAPHRPAPAPLEWSAPIAASACEVTSCDYPLPPNTPVATLEIAPSDIDTIAEVMVLGQVDAGQLPPQRRWPLHGSLHALRLKARHAAAPPGTAWDSAAVVDVYWLSQPSGAPELHSPPLRLDGARWRSLRLQTPGPISQLGHAAPTIRIAVRRRRLVFAARGAAPFMLVRAPQGAASAAPSLAALMPGRAPDAPPPAASATIAAIAPAALPASATSAAALDAAPGSRTVWRWAAPLAGVASLAALVGLLLRRRSNAA